MESILTNLAKEGGVSILAVLVSFLVLRSWLTKNSKALEDNTEEIKGLSHAIVKLEVQLEALAKLGGRVDRIEKGIQILFKNGGAE